MATKPQKRAYDATSRIERAAAEKAETRTKVVTAAQKLFVQKGYVATTIADIAKEAGVAVQSVYTAGQSKMELLSRVVDLTVAGDFDDVKVADRPFFAEIVAERDAVKQIGLLAQAMAAIQIRLAPVWVAYREAAAIDAKAAMQIAAEQARRRETLGAAVAALPAKRLRQSPAASADTLWALGSIDVHLLLMTQPGWTNQRYTAWLHETLLAVLLKPTTK